MDHNSIINDDTKKDLMDVPSLDNLTEEQKQKLDQLSSFLMQRVLTRVAHVLTVADINKIDELDKEDESGEQVTDYIKQLVPNFEAIIDEEADKIKKEILQEN
jgi:hypothetical protein